MVANFGAGDLLEVRRPGKPSVYLPFTRAVVPTLDFAAGKAIVESPDGLLDEAGAPEDGEDVS